MLSEIVRMAEGMVAHLVTLIKGPLEHAAIFRPSQITPNRKKSSLDPTLSEEIKKTRKRLCVEARGISIDAGIDQALIILIVVEIDTDADFHRLKPSRLLKENRRLPCPTVSESVCFSKKVPNESATDRFLYRLWPRR